MGRGWEVGGGKWRTIVSHVFRKMMWEMVWLDVGVWYIVEDGI
jgi:hypothetical protein